MPGSDWRFHPCNGEFLQRSSYQQSLPEPLLGELSLFVPQTWERADRTGEGGRLLWHNHSKLKSRFFKTWPTLAIGQKYPLIKHRKDCETALSANNFRFFWRKCLFAHSVCGRSGLNAHGPDCFLSRNCMIKNILSVCWRSGLFAHSPGYSLYCKAVSAQ